MDPKQELIERIRKVRRDWTQFICFRGIAWTLGVTLVTLVFALSLSGLVGLPSWAVVLLRLILITAVVATALIKLARPLLERPEDIQFARLVEERYPGLNDRFVSAIEIVNKPSSDSGPFGALLVQDALERTSQLGLNDIVNRTKYKRIVALSGIFLVCLFGTAYFSNLFFPNGSARLFAGLLEPPPIPLVRIEVSPGNMTVPVGSDVVLEAVIKGVDLQLATVHFRYDNNSRWEASGMEVTPVVVPTFRHLLFNVREPIRYYVKAAGHKSAEYVIGVADLPQVQSLDYKYIYPSYTGLKSRTEEDGLDIVAIRGTSVEVQVNVDQDLSSGRFVFNDGSELKLKTSSNSEATTLLKVDKDRSFRIELVNLQGQRHLGLHEYGIEALEDEKPFIRFTEPGRDFKASTVEEVFTELSAEDDIGVELMELYFSVNGAEMEKIELFSSRGPAPNKISSSYTFFLEEYEIEPGDFFTYYARAVDSMNPGNEAITDIYFIEVRPFGQEYFQGQSGGQNNGQRDSDTGSAAALSRRQKEVVAATFRLIRDERSFGESEFSDNIRAVADSQKTLAQQTRTLLARLTSRGLVSRGGISGLSDYMVNALEQMGPAVRELEGEQLESALPHEQKALQFLMRAETLFNEIQVTQGGGNSGSSAEDLADLFDLELDQSKNQYETLERSELSRQSSGLDEALRRLEELARRQQKMVEQHNRSTQSRESIGSRRINNEQIRRETQRLARQLDRLSRKNNNREMRDVGRALQEAARNMQEARNGSSQQQIDASKRALKHLDKAQELMAATQGGSLDERLTDLQSKANRLSDRQAEIAQQAEILSRDPETDLPGRTDQILELKKDAVNSLRQIEESLKSLRGNHERQETVHRIRAAANLIRSGRLFDKMSQGQQLLENGYFEYARQRERELEQNFNELERQLGEAATSAANTDEKRVQAALNQTSEAILRLESLQRRAENYNYNSQGKRTGVREEGHNERVRQVTREWEERVRDVMEIQELLDKNSRLQRDLNKILDAMRIRLKEYHSDDPENVETIKRSIIEPFRSVELDLSRQLQLLIIEDSILSVHEEEIPAGYRSLVEDYYKRLSEEETRKKD